MNSVHYEYMVYLVDDSRLISPDSSCWHQHSVKIDVN